ncbi:uncharacterized protein LOC117100897 isoform X1 [Anneissia japonica]|uniref:uncharacterized protein LOC117100897 isoform X1 n=1 Tax=Anneissia japonica TaxID=1529436 RepID=UPI0014259BC3|nr:uncharacterized protein LOC117100897 isoform X1 [Anneissia japonica]
MTTQEFQSKWCVTIRNHKTATQGPALLILEKDLVEMMTMYKNIVHNQPEPDGTAFFVCQNDGEVRPCQDLTRLWHHLGVRLGKSINCTHFRKTTCHHELGFLIIQSWRQSNIEKN